MPKTDPLPRTAAALLHAPPSPLDDSEPNSKQPKWNDTPDAMCHWPAWRPQSQHRRGLAPTTAPREADHARTTTHATH